MNYFFKFPKFVFDESKNAKMFYWLVWKDVKIENGELKVIGPANLLNSNNNISNNSGNVVIGDSIKISQKKIGFGNVQDIVISGKNIQIKDNEIVVDGNVQKVNAVRIVVKGDVERLVNYSANITINGNVTSIDSSSGDIIVNGNIEGSIKTTSGNVKIDGYMTGDVFTTSGNVRRPKMRTGRE